MKKQKVKSNGQVFTPDYLVKYILDVVGYIESAKIFEKHIIDDSCGAGAFLTEIIKRFIKSGLNGGKTIDEIKAGLEFYIHGIEVDPVAYAACIENLNSITASFNIHDVNWDVHLENTLTEYKAFEGKMDFVVGNPPYVRVHNLNEYYDQVKSFEFANIGQMDLYIVFFELGFKMLKEGGKLCYITPSSWLNSIAGEKLREYIFDHKNLLALIDLEHFQPFKGITTFTIISLFERSKHAGKTFDYYTYNSQLNKGEFISSLSYDDAFIDGVLYLEKPQALKDFKKIRAAKNFKKWIKVKSGLGTNADDVFIAKDFPFTKHVIPCLKASTGKWFKAFFPYDENGKALPPEEIFDDEKTAEYLNKHKERLLKRVIDKKQEFYLYGKSQAIRDVRFKKISINALIKDVKSIKLIAVKAGEGVYSGFYILTDEPFEIIESLIKTEEFIDYVKMLKKYKSGGYYTFSPKDLEMFLNDRIKTKCKTRTIIYKGLLKNIMDD